MITDESGSGRQPVEVPLFDGSRFGISQFGLLVKLWIKVSSNIQIPYDISLYWLINGDTCEGSS